MTWFEDLYNRQIYFDLYATEDLRLARGEVDRLVQLLDLSPAQSILDVCCGYGRHALELARRGYSVTGIDLAPLQIEVASKQAVEEGLEVNFHRVDAREMKFARPFDVVLNLFTSFGFFDNENENQRMMTGISEVTVPGGLFLMDFWNREAILRNFKPIETEIRPDGILVEKLWFFDAWNGRLNWENRVTLPNGAREIWRQSVRAYTLIEMINLLKNASFDVEKVYGDWDGTTYTIDAPQMIIIARRE